jgi:hypothetical protein
LGTKAGAQVGERRKREQGYGESWHYGRERICCEFLEGKLVTFAGRERGEGAGGTPALRTQRQLQRQRKSNSCPVPQTGAGRYTVKSKVKDAHLKKQAAATNAKATSEATSKATAKL